MKLTQTGQAVAWATAAGAAGLLFFFVDPAWTAWLPACPLHTLTGWNCPGCGSTRALHQLAGGHLGPAFHCNPLLVLGLPVVGLGLALRRSPKWRPIWTWSLVGLVVVFGVVRNIPAYPFTLLNP